MKHGQRICVAIPLLLLTSIHAYAAPRGDLQKGLEQLAAESDGRVGICALEITSKVPTCVNANQSFPLQSVMKMIVAAALLDAVDEKKMTLNNTITLRPQDASPGPQDLADTIRAKGELAVSLGDLMQKAVIESDSTSVDALVKHLGGTAAVQKFLARKNIDGIRIDRNERWVQADSVGLEWKAEYADDSKFEAEIEKLSFLQRDKAAKNYLKDPRDTATPAGMVGFLKTLAEGKLLSKKSTQKLLEVMTQAVTGANRLRAGLPQGWSLAHKTGTGRTWQGANSAINDVGIVTTPSGDRIAIAAFVSGSSQPNPKREALIANSAKLVTSFYGKN